MMIHHASVLTANPTRSTIPAALEELRTIDRGTPLPTVRKILVSRSRMKATLGRHLSRPSYGSNQGLLLIILSRSDPLSVLHSPQAWKDYFVPGNPKAPFSDPAQPGTHCSLAWPWILTVALAIGAVLKRKNSCHMSKARDAAYSCGTLCEVGTRKLRQGASRGGTWTN